MADRQDLLTKAADILVVDDSIASLRLLSEILTNEGYRVRPTERPQSAIESAMAYPPSLILLDVKMPEMDGFEVCRRLKQEERTRDIPIIFVSALQDVRDRIRGFEAGGVDFISKPFQESEVLARVRTHLALRNMRLHLEDLVTKRTAELTATNKTLETEISERKNAEDEIRRNRDYLKDLTNSIGDVVFSVKMPERKIEWVNDSSFIILGYDPEELIGRTTEFLYPNRNEFLAFGDKLTGAIAQGKDIIHIEQLLRRKSGEAFPAEFTVTIHKEKGGVVTTTGIIRDVSERKQAEMALQESRQHFQLLFERHHAVMLLIDPDSGKIVDANPAAATFYGYSRTELRAMNIAAINRLDPEQIADKRQNAKTGTGNYFIFPHRLVNGEIRTVEVYSTPIDIQDRKLLFSIIHDITERHQAEEALKAYQQRLKALASQLTITEEKERRRIAADLHDNVGQSLALARIQIASVRKLGSDPRQIAMLDEISDSLRHTVQETRDLIYALSPPQLNEIGLSAAISEWLEDQVEKRYGLKAECIVSGSEEPMDNNMRTILFRSVRELVTNVIKHARATRVNIRVNQDNDRVKIIVRDDGAGFDANTISQSIKTEGGFGLFSIKERMADLGGSLEIISEPGQGTEVILTVPLEKEEENEEIP